MDPDSATFRKKKWDGICRVWGSPLEGKRLPDGWREFSLDEKRNYLLQAHLAADYHDACSMLSQHGHAVRAMRKRREEAKQKREGQNR